MNREILFRGKSTIDGNWIYGFLNYSEQQNIYYIGFTELMTPVIPETVGQFTGLTDKNGVRIFEGKNSIKLHIIGIGDGLVDVVMNEGKWSVFEKTQGFALLYDLINNTNFEITGNIHDNK